MKETNYFYQILKISTNIKENNLEIIAKNLEEKYENFFNLIFQEENIILNDNQIPFKMKRLLILLKKIINNYQYDNCFANKKIYSLNSIVKFLKYKLYNFDREVLILIFLDARQRFIKDEIIFYGTLDKVDIYYRDILKKILNYNAKYIIMAHNHLSGIVNPTKEDIDFTNRLIEILEIFEVKVLDHIIISKNDYYSFFREEK